MEIISQIHIFAIMWLKYLRDKVKNLDFSGQI